MTHNITVVTLRVGEWEIGVASVYWEGDKPIETYIEWIGKVINDIGTKNILLRGYGNVWNIWWRYERVDHRRGNYRGFVRRAKFTDTQ